MAHSLKRFVGSFSLAAAVTAALVLLVLMSQLTMALLPVLGIGGFYMEASTFFGNNGAIYPAAGQDTPTPLGAEHGTIDTARCPERPMLVFDLESAEVQGYTVYKDIKIPYVSDRWMTITMDQPSGSLEGSQLRIFTTQAWMDQLIMDNILLTERQTGRLFGPQSGEFLMRGDPQNYVAPDLEANTVKMWVHAVTGDGVTFRGNPVRMELTYPTTTQIENRYSGEGVLAPNGRNRDTYFDCTPP